MIQNTLSVHSHRNATAAGFVLAGFVVALTATSALGQGGPQQTEKLREERREHGQEHRRDACAAREDGGGLQLDHGADGEGYQGRLQRPRQGHR